MEHIFISYSRKNQEIADCLRAALEKEGQSIWIDKKSIPLSANWWLEIQEGIRNAHTFICVISQASLTSPECTLEVAYALETNKRIVPVLYEKVDMDAVIIAMRNRRLDAHLQERLAGRKLSHLADKNWDELQKINWVSAEQFGDLSSLTNAVIQTVNTNLPYIKYWHWLRTLAEKWHENAEDTSFLLRGTELRIAEGWLDNAQGQVPPPSELHQSYIAASIAEKEREQKAVQEQHDREVRLQRDKERNQELYEQVRGIILRFSTASIGFGVGFAALIFTLYADPQMERTTQRTLAAVLSLVMGTFFGAAMVFVFEFMPRSHKQAKFQWLGSVLFVLGYLACLAALTMFVYIYQGDPNLVWLPISAFIMVGSFGIPGLFITQFHWQIAIGLLGAFLALFLPTVLDSNHAPILFLTVRNVDMSVPLNAWLAFALTIGAFFPELVQWVNGFRKANSEQYTNHLE